MVTKMMNLLYKEWKLCTNTQIYIMMFLGFLVVIPNYPIFVVPIFLMSVIPQLFAIGRATNDIFYTVTLPIKRKDVVKSKILFLSSLEIIFIFVTLIALIFSIYMSNNRIAVDEGINGVTSLLPGNSTGMDANIAIIGIYFLTFGIFNLFMFPLYYKNPNRLLIPFLLGSFISIVFAGGLSSLLAFIPFLAEYFDALTIDNWYIQLGFTALCILIFLLLNFISLKISQKHFEKIDI